MHREDLRTQLFENMTLTKRLIHQRWQNRLGIAGLSHGQLELLFTIQQLQPVSPKQLAAHLKLTPGAISQLLDSLFAHQWLRRETDALDRRTYVLYLSKKGQQKVDSISAERERFMQELMADLTREELVVMLRIQQKLAERLQCHTDK
jgi:DNA-binding MarR family transcriptional regulator